MYRIKQSFSVCASIAALACCALSVSAQGKMQGMDMGRYGGEVYSGKPNLAVTAALVKAGGGAGNFSAAHALSAMVGEKMAGDEIAKLTKQFGEEKVGSFVTVHNFAIEDALTIATAAGVKLPEAKLSGKKLAGTLLAAGMQKDGTFYVGLLLDKAVTHAVHVKVMDDIDAKYGKDADANYHTISDQLFYDLGKAFGNKQVKLAPAM